MLRSMRRDALQWWKGPDKKYFCVMLGFAVFIVQFNAASFF